MQVPISVAVAGLADLPAFAGLHRHFYLDLVRLMIGIGLDHAGSRRRSENQVGIFIGQGV
jgi:hypothetical protein